VRDLLREGRFTCGVEPRILKGRDPDWTCIVNGKNGAGDVYIHRLDSILGIDTTAFASRLRIGDAQSRVPIPTMISLKITAMPCRVGRVHRGARIPALVSAPFARGLTRENPSGLLPRQPASRGWSADKLEAGPHYYLLLAMRL
jgi:hypothetical protein